MNLQIIMHGRIAGTPSSKTIFHLREEKMEVFRIREGSIDHKGEHEGGKGEVKEQVTRGHNIFEDGLAGASNPKPHPNPPQLSNIHKTYLKHLFSHFSTP